MIYYVFGDNYGALLSQLFRYAYPAGVFTKYLNNYPVWNNLVKFAKETSAEKAVIFLEFVATTQKSGQCRTLSHRPNLPLLV